MSTSFCDQTKVHENAPFVEPVASLTNINHPLFQEKWPETNLLKGLIEVLQKHNLRFQQKDESELTRFLYQNFQGNLFAIALALAALSTLRIQQSNLFYILQLFARNAKKKTHPQKKDMQIISKLVEEVFTVQGEQALYVAEVTLLDGILYEDHEEVLHSPYLAACMLKVICNIVERTLEWKNRYIHRLTKMLELSSNRWLNGKIVHKFARWKVSASHVVESVKRAFRSRKVDLKTAHGDYVDYCERVGAELDPFDTLVKDRPVPSSEEFKKKLKQLKSQKLEKRDVDKDDKIIRTSVAPDEIPPEPLKIEPVSTQKITKTQSDEQIILKTKEFYETLFLACSELKLIEQKKKPNTITESMVASYIQKLHKYYDHAQEEPKTLNRSILHCFVDTLDDPNITLRVIDVLKGIVCNRTADILVDLGIASVIVSLLSKGDKILDQHVVQLLLNIIGNLSKNDFSRGFRLIETEGILPAIYRIIEKGTRESSLSMCYAMEELATIEGIAVELIKKDILKRSLALIKSEDPELREEGVRITHALSVGNVRIPPLRTSHKAVIKTIVQADTIEKLVAMLNDKEKKVAHESAAAIGHLTRDEDCCARILQNDNIKIIFQILVEADKKAEHKLVSDIFITLAHICWERSVVGKLFDMAPDIFVLPAKWGKRLFKVLMKKGSLSEIDSRLFSRSIILLSSICSEKKVLEKIGAKDLIDFLLTCSETSTKVDVINGALGSIGNMWACDSSLITKAHRLRLFNILRKLLYIAPTFGPNFQVYNITNLTILLYRDDEIKPIMDEAAKKDRFLDNILISASKKFCRTCKRGDGELKTSMKRCSRCKRTWYCSKECQKQDWSQRHKKECVPATEKEYEQQPCTPQ